MYASGFDLDKHDARDRIVMIGTWRSLEAHLNGVQGVGGSNPPVPIIKK